MQSPQELYDEFVALNDTIERKGKTMPYTAINGNMFSFLGKDGVIGLRLPKEERTAFLKNTRPSSP